MPHTLELTDDELELLRAALHSYLDDFGHEEAGRAPADQGAAREAASARALFEQCCFALVLWNLADSKTTIAELRRYLRDESVDAFEDVGRPALQGVDLRRGDRPLGRGLLLGVARRRREQELPSARARADRQGPRHGRGVRPRGDERGRFAGRRSSRGSALAFEQRLRGRASRGRPRRPRSARAGTGRGRTAAPRRAARPRRRPRPPGAA